MVIKVHRGGLAGKVVPTRSLMTKMGPSKGEGGPCGQNEVRTTRIGGWGEEFPLWLSRLRTQLISMRMQVRWISGLIQWVKDPAWPWAVV